MSLTFSLGMQYGGNPPASSNLAIHGFAGTQTTDEKDTPSSSLGLLLPSTKCFLQVDAQEIHTSFPDRNSWTLCELVADHALPVVSVIPGKNGDHASPLTKTYTPWAAFQWVLVSFNTIKGAPTPSSRVS